MALNYSLLDGEGGKEGLFVIIRNINHRLQYPTEEHDYTRVRELNYGPDETHLLEVFKLEHTPDNLLLKLNLTNKDGGNCFDTFISEVCGRKKKPAFLMFFLMSHGFEDGDFLLGTKQNKDVDCCCTLERNIWQYNNPGKEQNSQWHRREDNCYARNIVKDVISKICKSSTYRDVPKIFVLQLCRGSNESFDKLKDDGRAAETSSSTQSHVTSETELFVPFPDTLVLNACVEGETATVSSADIEGSLLIQYFCKALEELKVCGDQFKRLVDIIKDTTGNKDKELEKVNQSVRVELSDRKEDITGGWIMNVCHRTSALVSNALKTKLMGKSPLGRLLIRTTHTDICALLDLTKRTDVAKRIAKDYGDALKALPKTDDSVRFRDTVSKYGQELKDETFVHLWYAANNGSYPLRASTDKKLMEDYLDLILRQMLDPASKQQPQVSNSLAKRLSFLKILEECQ